MKFLDEVKIFVSSGRGGPGCVSFRREANLPRGGPDGGDGGNGGNVIIETVPGLNTLIDFRYKQHFKAKSGQHGMGRNRSGSNGEDITLKVPTGTIILDETKSIIITDLDKTGEKFILAKGGQGGKGNSFFKSSINQSPTKFQPGKDCEEKVLWLRLKLIADVGLVGLPNAGKSTFLSRITHSKPKIADYPFTTLHPNLGVANVDKKEFVIADLPGLIESAHKGKGLGHRFLGHIERCKLLLHLIDISSTKIYDDYKTINNELKNYDHSLLKKEKILVFTKCDIFEEKQIQEIKGFLKNKKIYNIFFISSVTGKNVLELSRHISKILSEDKMLDKKLNESDIQNWEP
mgnify:FL=1